jgi:hypothetical protein
MLPMTPQFLFGLGKSAVKRLGVTFFAYAIAQPKTVFATLVNAALNEPGEDSLSGMKLLQEVIKSPDCPLDVRITCSGLLLKHEMPLANEQQYIAYMPPAMPGDTTQSQMAVWWALYGDVPAGDDPEWDSAVKIILERIPSKRPPRRIQ